MEYHIILTNNNNTLDIPITNNNNTLDILFTGKSLYDYWTPDTKEKAEILNGSFIGNHIYERIITIHINKLAKIIDKL